MEQGLVWGDTPLMCSCAPLCLTGCAEIQGTDHSLSGPFFKFCLLQITLRDEVTSPPR